MQGRDVDDVRHCTVAGAGVGAGASHTALRVCTAAHKMPTHGVFIDLAFKTLGVVIDLD